MKIYVLGSGGWIPRKSHETACYMLIENKSICLLDCGSGVINIEKWREILEQFDRLIIVFSHYHLDHIIGLFYLKNWVKDKKLCFIGPTHEEYKGGVKKQICLLFENGYIGGNVENIASDVEFIDYTDGDTLVVDDFCFKFDIQKHSNPSYRITVNEQFVYATDTDEVVDILKDGREKILLQECWEYKKVSLKHTSFEEILIYSRNYKGLKIGLIHVNPFISDEEIRQINESLTNTNIFWVMDDDKFEI